MNTTMLPTAIGWLSTMYLMYYFHEAGHYITIRSYGLNVTKIHFTRNLLIPVPCAVSTTGTIRDEKKSTLVNKTILLFMSGPITGLIPIIVCQMMFPDTLLIVAFSWIYLDGCKGDFKGAYDVFTKGETEGLKITEDENGFIA